MSRNRWRESSSSARPRSALSMSRPWSASGRRSAPGSGGQWFDQGWIWLSLGLLIGVGILMFPMARRHFRRIRMILELMETGTAVSQDDFARVVNSGNPVLTAGTGFVAILFILYLMVLKPF